MRHFMAVFWGLVAVLPASAVQLARLRCEFQEAPLAVQAARPRLSWQLQAENARQQGVKQAAYRVLVASASAALAANRGDMWDSGRVRSNESFQVVYQGAALESGKEYYWKVQVWDQTGKASSWSVAATWRMGLRRPEDWKANWIAAQPDGEEPSTRMPIFRRAFTVDQPVARAIAYVSGLGQYELSINGKKIGDDVLAPGWTNYRKTVLYNAYDVTAALKKGDNAAGVMLGSGFYHVPKVAGRYTKLVGSFGQPRLIAQIHVEFAGGGSMEIGSDTQWKTAPGPITFSHNYGGEDYDARLEQAGWNEPGFEDREWKATVVVAAPGGELTAQMNPPIRVMKSYKAQKVTGISPGVRVYDLGQNLSGWPRLTVRGAAGAVVKLTPGELLNADGTASQRSSGAPQWYTYTLKGNGTEVWSPRFSYYGFRYVQAEVSGKAEVVSVQSEFTHAAAPVIGEFSCSNDLLNRIHALIDAAIKSNMQSVLTDCPHREKLGWLEESHLLGSAIMYNYGVESLYEKIANDIRDAQTEEGLVPDIAPEYTVFEGGFRDSPEWGAAAILNPWLAYRHFGNRSLIAAQYDVMSRYVEYLGKKAHDGLLSYGLGDWYDIGPKPPGVAQLTMLAVTATAIYYADLMAMRDAARMLHRAPDAAAFEKTAAAVREAFNAKFFDAALGVYDRGSQTAYAMPLVFGIAPAERRGELLKKLVDDVRAHRNHTTAGDIGFHFVVTALSEGGRSDVVYDIVSNPDAPSYAGQLAAGATTLTEAWDANPRSSQNHFMLGHVEEWFYRYLAGIDIDLSRPQGEQIVLRPTPVGDLTWARASYESVWGRITSSWKRTGGKLIYDAVVPPNASAKVLLPGRGGVEVKQVESGRHHFEVEE